MAKARARKAKKSSSEVVGRKGGLITTHVRPAGLTPEKRAELVKVATKLAIEMHRDALKELERY